MIVQATSFRLAWQLRFPLVPAAYRVWRLPYPTGVAIFSLGSPVWQYDAVFMSRVALHVQAYLHAVRTTIYACYLLLLATTYYRACLQAYLHALLVSTTTHYSACGDHAIIRHACAPTYHFWYACFCAGTTTAGQSVHRPDMTRQSRRAVLPGTKKSHLHYTIRQAAVAAGVGE